MGSWFARNDWRELLSSTVQGREAPLVLRAKAARVLLP